MTAKAKLQSRSGQVSAPNNRKPYLAGRKLPRCWLCKGPNDTRGVNCSSCRDRFNAKQNAEYAERRAAGRCVDCNAPSKRYAMCAACRARRKARPSRNGSSPRVVAQRKRWRSS